MTTLKMLPYSRDNSKAYFELSADSSEAKPTETYENKGILDGSIILETDTTKFYVYCEKSKTWTEAQ